MKDFLLAMGAVRREAHETLLIINERPIPLREEVADQLVATGGLVGPPSHLIGIACPTGLDDLSLNEQGVEIIAAAFFRE